MFRGMPSYEFVYNDTDEPVTVWWQHQGSSFGGSRILEPNYSMSSYMKRGFVHEVCVQYTDPTCQELAEETKSLASAPSLECARQACQETSSPVQAGFQHTIKVSNVIVSQDYAVSRSALSAVEPRGSLDHCAERVVPGLFALASLTLALIGLRKFRGSRTKVRGLQEPLMQA